MSDEWQLYQCLFNGHQASVMVDTGNAEVLRGVPAICAQIRLLYKWPDERGLPTQQEFDAVNTVEDALQDFADASRDIYVGRVTSDGSRTFYTYTRRDEAEWEHFVNTLASESGYRLLHRLVADPDYKMYWDELYPNDIAWREINDREVCNRLKANGDDGRTERPIDHWVYFPNEQAARPYIDWAVGNGFRFLAELSGVGDDGQYCARLQHTGPGTPDEVSGNTVPLMKKATELGGSYDGWETQVIGGTG